MNTTKSKWVTIRNEYGETIRVDLTKLKDLDISIREGRWATGVKLEAVYLQPRINRVILETYSIWENPQTHGCVGTVYSVADDMDIARIGKIIHDPYFV